MGKIHTARDLERAARKANCQIQNGGNHSKIVTPSGYAVPYPNHPGDLCTGTLHSILKMLKAAGIILGIIVCAVVVKSISDPVFGYMVWTSLFGA